MKIYTTFANDNMSLHIRDKNCPLIKLFTFTIFLKYKLYNMNKLTLSLLALTVLLSNVLFAQNEFITKWDTNIPDLGLNTQIKYPGVGTNYTLVITELSPGSWSNTITATGSTTITVPEAGIYEIKASPGSGTFTGINFGNTPGVMDEKKIIEVSKWGNIAWTTMKYAFNACVNLDITATDSPNLSGVTNMSYALSGCSSLSIASHINDWNVSTVTNMERLFNSCTKFNQSIANWNTGNVTDMNNMFAGAITYNQNMVYTASTNAWNTSKVTNMSGMFLSATAFNGVITNWQTGSVTDMNGMFSYASSFDQPIGNWDVSKVTDMQYMFQKTPFNKPLNTWDVGKVKRMYGMFVNASKFDQPLNDWNTSSVQNMAWMFNGASAFDQNIGMWNLTSITQKTGTLSTDNYNGMAVMLTYCGMSCVNYNLTLKGWAANLGTTTPKNVKLGAEGRNYSTANADRATLISNVNGWTITGDSEDATCGPLPVKFGNISAIYKADGIFLTWSTLSETNVNHYDIEVSKDGLNFRKVGEVSSKNIDNTSMNNTYEFTIADSALLGSIPFLLILGTLAARRNRKNIVIVMLTIAIAFTWIGCKKSNTTNAMDTEKTYLRIVEVDNTGAKQFSKVIQVTKQ